MNMLKTFFGQILRKVDLSYAFESIRSADVQQNIDFTDTQGGVVSGLDVTRSIDGKSVLITPGVFYSKGGFKNQNNLGGGERGEVFSIQAFNGLPPTAPIRDNPSYLLVYAKITTQNINPDPTKNQQITTSKNILTGENVATRDYAYATIVISNPILRSEISRYNGIPLALLTVDYNEVGTQLSTGGIIQTIITDGIKQPYIIGGSVDILNNQLVAGGIPDSFIVDRMVADDSLSASKIADSTVLSSKIAIWDGATPYDDLTGGGVANQHLKDGAITTSKLNYNQSLSGFSGRNRLLNSSFEFPTTGSTQIPMYWNITNTGTFSQVVIGGPGAGFKVKYGSSSLFMNGGTIGASNIAVDQVVNFNENLTGMPLSPSFWAQLKAFPSTGTYLQGSIEFLNASSGTAPNGGPFIFATVSGTDTTWQRYSNTSPIIYSGIGAPTLVRYKIGGTFNGSYYVDGAFLGMTDILPEFDINPSEYTELSGFMGDITSDQIGDGTITTRHIRQANGVATNQNGAGIVGSQIRDAQISTNHIQDGSITSDKLAPNSGLIPKDAIIIWTTGITAGAVLAGTNPCPDGFREAIEFRGFLPLGVNVAGGPFDTPGIQTNPAANNLANFTAQSAGNHSHSINTGWNTGATGGGGDSIASSTNDAGAHTHSTAVPTITVFFCRKN